MGGLTSLFSGGAGAGAGAIPPTGVVPPVGGTPPIAPDGGTAGAPAPGGFGGFMSKNQDLMAGMGAEVFKSGSQQQDQLAAQLAAMGPPPPVQMPQAMPPTAGSSLVGDKYKAMMQGVAGRPPAMMRTRQDAQMNPSVGQLLTQGY